MKSYDELKAEMESSPDSAAAIVGEMANTNPNPDAVADVAGAMMDQNKSVKLNRNIINDAYKRILLREAEPSLDIVSITRNAANLYDYELMLFQSEEFKNLKKIYDFYTVETLDEFVEKVDSCGGFGIGKSVEYIDKFRFLRPYIDLSLDPYSDEYFDFQVDFYEKITGSRPNQAVTELADFDLKVHSKSSNPQAHWDSAKLSTHIIRLSNAFKDAKLPQRAKLLDMGCGWGTSCELGSFFDLEVCGLDINKKFVNLVNRRNANNPNVSARQGDFENIPFEKDFDAILYNESLHHGLKLWDTLQHSFEHLKLDGGKLILVGEPINDEFWRSWGLRCDAESMYVMRKHGWFESGWSMDFLTQCLYKVGYVDVEVFDYPGPIGFVVVATKI